MIGLTYTLSYTLRDTLQKIESLRRQILLAPLAPKTELRLRWEAMVNRLYWSLTLSDNSLSKRDMIELIRLQKRVRLSAPAQDVVRYKRALDYISQEWLASPKVVTTNSVLTLHDLACRGRLTIAESALKRFLAYLQAYPENPCIQAALAQIGLVDLAPFTDCNGRTSRLLALLFLYKAGFDVRGLLAQEEYFRRDLVAFRGNTENALRSRNASIWLEYFAQCLASQLGRVLQDIYSQRFRIDLSSSFWQLNDRQRSIVALLDEPLSTMTNKKVQKLFKVSQITASRDLTKLTTLGMLFAHGKGRSIYYTRV